MNFSFLSRIRLLSFFIVLVFLLLVTKLFFVQILHKNAYRDRADRQYVTPAENIFERGSIFFKSKDESLIGAAMTYSGFKIAINPKEIVDAEDAYHKINSIFPIDEKSFLAKSAKKNDPYEEIANRLAKDQADKINGLKLSGVFIHKENWRFYPGSDLASHAVGFVGYKDDELSGRTGLESYYNQTLSRSKEDLYMNLFAEIFSNIKKSFSEKTQDEGDVILSIEPTVQSFLQKALAGIVEDWRSDAVGGIIINPIDGTIYAMAHTPSYDLNNFSKIKDISILSNPIVENVYEFGSIVKPLTMAAGLDAGVVTAATTYDDKGFVILNKRKINNFDHKGRGVVNMQEVLNQSLNTGTVFVMQHLGKDRFNNYLLSYGLGEKTGIDLPAEISGLVGNLESNVEVDQATASFGQGIALTPIEMARAFSVLANGGKLIVPHLATEIKYVEGGSKKIEYQLSAQVISKQSSEEITRMLIQVVDKALLGGTVKMDHYSIAAKTGTAQMSKGNGGGYYEDRYLHSFFGYFPAYNPKFLILLYNIYPKGAQYASHTLTYPFMDLAKFLINYYNIPPDR